MEVNILPTTTVYSQHDKTTICQHNIILAIDGKKYDISGYGSAKCSLSDKFNCSFGNQLALQRAKVSVGKKIEQRLLDYSKRFAKYQPKHTFKYLISIKEIK